MGESIWHLIILSTLLPLSAFTWIRHLYAFEGKKNVKDAECLIDFDPVFSFALIVVLSNYA